MAKLARKKNWKKRLVGAREANGRLSRCIVHVAARKAEAEKEIKSIMVDARMRHTGLAAKFVDLTDAGRPNAGTAHGILYLQKAIKIDQWTAAEWYLEKRGEYMRSILAKSEASNRDGLGRTSEDSAEYIAWCKDAATEWADIRDCLQDASVESRSPIMAALDHILIRGQHNLDHMIGDLRLGLNAVHRRFLVGKSNLTQLSKSDNRHLSQDREAVPGP